MALRHCTVLLIWRGARRRGHGLLPSAAKRRQAVLLQAGDGTFGCRLRPPGLLPLGLAPKKGAKETKPPASASSLFVRPTRAPSRGPSLPSTALSPCLLKS